MSKQNLLQQVKHDITAGQLGQARQRLHTLVNLYPDDLSLRRRLGDVYAQLQYPERAGCYWYLEENKTPEMEIACEAFVKSCGRRPFVILRTLKFRGGPEVLPQGFARATLEGLREHAPNYRFPIFKSVLPPLSPGGFADTVFKYGCLVLAVLMGIVFVIGLITVWRAGSAFVLDFMR